MSTNNENLYAIDDLTEQEIRRIKEDSDRNKGSQKFHYLSPGQRESMRSSNLRPIFDPKNKFGQEKPVVRGFLHEGLSSKKPGTNQKPFPFIMPGVDIAVCLNDSDEEHYCNVCPRSEDAKKEKSEIQKEADSTDSNKAVQLARAFRNWYSKFKRTLFHFFAAVRHIGPVTAGEEWKKGKVPIKKDPDKVTARNKHGFVVCNKEEAELWVDPLRIIKWKDWWIKPFFSVVNERKMTPQKYATHVGRAVTQEEYLRDCPKKRPLGPFEPTEGYDIEVTVSGKGRESNWEVRADESEKLSTLDMIALLTCYPDVMAEITPYGSDRVPTFEDWCKENSADPSAPKSRLDYNHKRKLILSEAQSELLGLHREAAGEKPPVEASKSNGDGSAEDVTIEEEDAGDIASYDLEGDIDIDLGSPLD